MEGVVYEVPVPSDVPPVNAAYQLIVPVAEADKATVPAPHEEPFVTLETVAAVLLVVKLDDVPLSAHPPLNTPLGPPLTELVNDVIEVLLPLGTP